MVDKAHQSSQKPKAPHDQSGAGGSDSGIVTREMRDAGSCVIQELYGVVSPEFLASEVYSAMVALSKKGCRD